MRAYWMQKSGKGAVVETPVPEPGPGELRVMTAYSGICGSDLHAYHGVHMRRPLPLIPGHETCGVVHSLGAGVDGPKPGTPVAVLAERGCGGCSYCRQGWTNVCTAKTLLGTQQWPGGFADYFCAPADRLIALPENISLKLYALAEPLAVAIHGVRQAGFREGQSMALIGVGGIGSLVLAVCKLAGAKRTIVCDLKDFNLDVARKQGADIILNTSQITAAEQFERNSVAMVDTVFIAASHHSLIDQSIRLAKPHGVILLLGQFNKPGTIDIDKSRLKEQHIIGSFTYTEEDFREAIRTLSSHPEVFRPLISAEIGLDDVDSTIKAMITGKLNAVKIVVNINGQRW